VKQQTGNSNIDCIRLDLGDLASVKEFSEAYKAKYPKIDQLILNAGTWPEVRRLTKDGFEECFGVNHLGHMFLTYQLLPLVKKSEGGRIVVLSSKRHMFGSVDWSDLQYEKKPFNGARAYEQAKIANVLFARELAKKLKSQGSDIVVSSVHPGVIKTELHRDGSIVLRTALTTITALFGKNVSQGVQTTLYGAVSSDLKDKSGHYLADCQITPPNAKEVSDESAKKMWDISCKLLSLPEDW
jgi:retinol dehydrogenase 12